MITCKKMYLRSLKSYFIFTAGDLTVGPNEKAEKSPTLYLDLDQVEKWLSQCHLFHHILQQVLKGGLQFFVR